MCGARGWLHAHPRNVQLPVTIPVVHRHRDGEGDGELILAADAIRYDESTCRHGITKHPEGCNHHFVFRPSDLRKLTTDPAAPSSGNSFFPIFSLSGGGHSIDLKSTSLFAPSNYLDLLAYAGIHAPGAKLR